MAVNSTNADDTVHQLPRPPAKGRDRPDPYSSRVRVDVAGLSHPGKVRPNNEDHFLISRFGRFLESVQTNLPPGTVPARAEEVGYGVVVADGMGGKAGGEEASRLAIASLVNLALHTPDWILRLDEEPLPEEVMRRAAERYQQVNQALAGEAQDNPWLRGFGTTMTLACSIGRELFVAHLGDSRAYVFGGGRLHQLTRDHTLAQALADQRLIERHEAATHRLRHVLTQSLGDHGRGIQPDVTRVVLDDGDCLLVCTDGLTEMVPHQEIGDILGAAESAEAACRRLVDRALEAGGKDNVTVAVARYRLP
jgi:protein phosphatase